MSRNVSSILPRAWNTVFGGELSRLAYFVVTITVNLTLGVIGFVVGVFAHFAYANESDPMVVLSLVAAYWAMALFGVGFFFWCMVLRLHHSGRTAEGAIGWLVITAILVAVAAASEADPTGAQVLVTVLFWLVVGLLKPKPEEFVYAKQ